MSLLTTLYGNPATFGIEYAPAQTRGHIHVRLWIAGNWVGDLAEPFIPQQFCIALLRLGSPAKYPQYTYLTEIESPTGEELIERGEAPWGAPFDPFGLDYYFVLASLRVHFVWRLQTAYYLLFADYPRHVQHQSVAIADYHAAVKPFIAEMLEQGFYLVLRRFVPGLADLDLPIR